MPERERKTLIGRCVAEVLRLGEASVSRVLARVGRHIDASPAANAGRRAQKSFPRLSAADRGRRRIVNIALCLAARRGYIRRVSPGVYAAPLPKLHEPAISEAG